MHEALTGGRAKPPSSNEVNGGLMCLLPTDQGRKCRAKTQGMQKGEGRSRLGESHGMEPGSQSLEQVLVTMASLADFIYVFHITVVTTNYTHSVQRQTFIYRM